MAQVAVRSVTAREAGDWVQESACCTLKQPWMWALLKAHPTCSSQCQRRSTCLLARLQFSLKCMLHGTHGLQTDLRACMHMHKLVLQGLF